MRQSSLGEKFGFRIFFIDIVWSSYEFITRFEISNPRNRFIFCFLGKKSSIFGGQKIFFVRGKSIISDGKIYL
jgi:hypothetical protein